jgi:roadblock/LC7 domain-containing protein
MLFMWWLDSLLIFLGASAQNSQGQDGKRIKFDHAMQKKQADVTSEISLIRFYMT